MDKQLLELLAITLYQHAHAEWLPHMTKAQSWQQAGPITRNTYRQLAAGIADYQAEDAAATPHDWHCPSCGNSALKAVTRDGLPSHCATVADVLVAGCAFCCRPAEEA